MTFAAASRAGDDILLDGYTGLLIPPKRLSRSTAGSNSGRSRESPQRLGLIRDTASTSSDGRHFILSANIELPEELDDVSGSGAEGVGLYRLGDSLSKPQQAAGRSRAIRELSARGRTIEALFGHHPNFLDVGGDKPSESLELEHEQNPFLGCRAIRFCLQHPEIFSRNGRAILRAAKAVGNVRLMYPMISGIEELRRANAVLNECRRGSCATKGQTSIPIWR